jgi:hypothetical protein
MRRNPMKRSMLRGILGFCLSLCIVFASYAQGVYWEATTSGSMKSDEAQVSQFYYMPRMLKVVEIGDDMAVILRLDKELMIVMNTREKTYWEMTFAEMEEMVKGAGMQMDAAMREMEKQMAGLSIEQQEMMKKMMGSRKPKEKAKIEVTRTNESKTIGGYRCTKYVLERGGEEEGVVWATKDMKEFEVMRKDMEEFGKRMDAMRAKESMGVEEAINAIDGFPIQTEMADGEKTVVTKVEGRSTPAKEFEVQAGFKKEESPMKKGFQQE